VLASSMVVYGEGAYDCPEHGRVRPAPRDVSDLEAVANRLVYGHRATPYEALTAFSHRVADAYADEDVLPKLASVLAEGTGATCASVWIRHAGELVAAATWPPTEAPLSRGVADRVAEVRHQAEALGELTARKRPGEPFTPVEETLMNDLAAQAGQVLRNVRLTSELQARLTEISAQAVELRASRQRIVAVGLHRVQISTDDGGGDLALADRQVAGDRVDDGVGHLRPAGTVEEHGWSA